MTNAADEIRQLYVLYARGLDLRDFARAKSIFAPEATIVGTFSSGSLEEYFPAIEQKVLEYGTTMHDVGTTDVHVTADNETTRADSYTVAHHLDPVGGGQPWVIAVCYSDRLERRADGWRILERHVSKLWERSSI
jgi:hypothetical protein